MIVNEETILQAKKIALNEDVFNKELHEWHTLKGQVKLALQQKNFDDWLYAMLCESSTYIDGVYSGEQTAEQIAVALRVDTIGDPLAIKLSESAKKSGFETDLNCYVEDGQVEANVWISGKDPQKTKEQADEICAKFVSEGYSAEVWIDEEDEHDVTVNAVIDFKSYLSPRKSDDQ